MKRIRPYQQDIVHEVVEHLRSNSGGLFELCVGSGKTLMAKMVATRLFQESLIDLAIVIAPQTNIRDQFNEDEDEDETCVTPSEETFPWGGNSLELIQVEMIDKGSMLLRRVHESQDPSRSQPPKLLATTYNLWRDQFKRIGAPSLRRVVNWSRVLIIIDEGHHVFVKCGAPEGECSDPLDSVGINLLGETEAEEKDLKTTSGSVGEAKRQGAKTLSLTATPSRYDNRNCVLEYRGVPDRKFTRGYLRHMVEGYAPCLQSKVLVVCPHGETDATTQSSPALDSDQESFQELIQDFQKAGCPLTIIRIRCSTGRNEEGELKHRATAHAMTQAFRDAGVDSVFLYHEGISKEDEKKWENIKKLAVEAKNSSGTPRVEYEELRSECNVLIVFNRANEGLDLVGYSHIYFWGVPRSMPVIIQVIGRGLRERIKRVASYPVTWGNLSMATFCVGGDCLQNAEEAKFMHQIGAWLYGLELGSLLSQLVRVIDGMENQGFKRTRDRAIAIVESDEYAIASDLLLRAEALWDELDFDNPLNLQDKTDVLFNLTLGITQEESIEMTPELKSIIRLLSDDKPGRAVRDLLQEAEGTENSPEIELVIQRFRQEFITQAQIHGAENPRWLIQGDLTEHYTRLGWAAGKITSLDVAVSKAKLFKEENQRWPTAYGRAATEDKVPGEYFYFDSYNGQGWKEVIVQEYLQENPTALKEDLSGIEAHLRNRKCPFNRLPSFMGYDFVPSRLKESPVIALFPYCLWIPTRLNWYDKLSGLSITELNLLGGYIGQGLTNQRSEGGVLPSPPVRLERLGQYLQENELSSLQAILRDQTRMNLLLNGRTT